MSDPNLAEAVATILRREGLMVATAESCTGGLVAGALTEVAGSSAWFERGFVTYSNQAKNEMLDVPGDLIDDHGAVSEEVARAMAEGAIVNSRAQVAVSVTGIAGPTGGSPDKPVGTVCFAWAQMGRPVTSETKHFDGDRQAVRAQSVRHALGGLILRVTPVPGTGRR
jgi:nicotinamide-nucleotide amidase